MTVHQIINIRESLQETHNIINASFYNIKKPIGESERGFYNLVQYCVKGKQLQTIQINEGLEVCRECSSEAGKTIEHFKNPVFSEFIMQPIIKKYSTQLTEMAKDLY